MEQEDPKGNQELIYKSQSREARSLCGGEGEVSKPLVHKLSAN